MINRVSVYSTSSKLGHGHRVVSWLASDGTKVRLQPTVGPPITVRLSELANISGVDGSKTVVSENRLLITFDGKTIDAGPLNKGAALPSDKLTTRKAKKKSEAPNVIGNTGLEFSAEDW